MGFYLFIKYLIMFYSISILVSEPDIWWKFISLHLQLLGIEGNLEILHHYSVCGWDPIHLRCPVQEFCCVNDQDAGDYVKQSLPFHEVCFIYLFNF